jgi:quinol monooxygenase YgiN
METMMAAGFHLYVVLKCLPEHCEELRKALQSLSRDSLASGICLRFDVLESQTAPNTFYLFESFESKQIYPDHVATAHAQHFLSHVIPAFVQERSIIFLEDTPFTN